MMLKNKVAIVTGGTRGIGFAVVKKFIENGAAVSLWGSRQETVDQALEQLKELYPDAKISGKYPSLKDTAQVTAMINQVKEEFGAVDILVITSSYFDTSFDFARIPSDGISLYCFT